MNWRTLAYALFRGADDPAEDAAEDAVAAEIRARLHPEVYGEVVEPPVGFEPEHSHRSALAGRRPERLGMGRVARHPQRIGTKG